MQEQKNKQGRMKMSNSTKKYSCKIVETYRVSIEIPENANLEQFILSDAYSFDCPDDVKETFTPIRNDSVVDFTLMKKIWR